MIFSLNKQENRNEEDSTQDQMRAFQRQIDQRKDKVRNSFIEISSLLEKLKCDQNSVKSSLPSFRADNPNFIEEISSVQMKDSQRLYKSLIEQNSLLPEDKFNIPLNNHFLIQHIFQEIQKKIDYYGQTLKNIEENRQKNQRSKSVKRLKPKIQQRKFDKLQPTSPEVPLTNLVLTSMLGKKQIKSKKNSKRHSPKLQNVKRSPKKLIQLSPKVNKGLMKSPCSSKINYHQRLQRQIHQHKQQNLDVQYQVWFNNKSRQLQNMILNKKVPDCLHRTSPYRWKIQKNIRNSPTHPTKIYRRSKSIKKPWQKSTSRSQTPPPKKLR